MQRQGDLHDQYPHVVDDGEQQLAQTLGLLVPAGGRGILGPDRTQLIESQEPFEQRRRLAAEIRPRRVEPDEAAFHEQDGETRGDAVLVEMEVREHLRRLGPFRGLRSGYRGRAIRGSGAGKLAHQTHRLGCGVVRRFAVAGGPARIARLHRTLRSLIP